MFKFSTVEEAIQAIAQGKIILVSDDADRENEGTSFVQRNLRHRKISTLWRNMVKG